MARENKHEAHEKGRARETHDSVTPLGHSGLEAASLKVHHEQYPLQVLESDRLLPFLESLGLPVGTEINEEALAAVLENTSTNRKAKQEEKARSLNHVAKGLMSRVKAEVQVSLALRRARLFASALDLQNELSDETELWSREALLKCVASLNASGFAIIGKLSETSDTCIAALTEEGWVFLEHALEDFQKAQAKYSRDRHKSLGQRP